MRLNGTRCVQQLRASATLTGMPESEGSREELGGAETQGRFLGLTETRCLWAAGRETRGREPAARPETQ